MTQTSLIVARASNGAIGLKGRMPWRIPDDLKFFKKTTMGHPVIMGWNTWESIGRPLPGRRNVVLTRSRPAESAPGAEIARSLDEALVILRDAEKVFVIGGAKVYEQALPIADEAYVTELDQEFEGDAFFRLPDEAAWNREVLGVFASGGCTGRFTRLTRIKAP